MQKFWPTNDWRNDGKSSTDHRHTDRQIALLCRRLCVVAQPFVDRQSCPNHDPVFDLSTHFYTGRPRFSPGTRPCPVSTCTHRRDNPKAAPNSDADKRTQLVAICSRLSQHCRCRELGGGGELNVLTMTFASQMRLNDNRLTGWLAAAAAVMQLMMTLMMIPADLCRPNQTTTHDYITANAP